MPSQQTADLVKLLATIVTALGMMVLIPLEAWELNKIDNHSERIAIVETQLGKGPRYTADDAEKDQGLLAKILDDHEIRLRVLENERR